MQLQVRDGWVLAVAEYQPAFEPCLVFFPVRGLLLVDPYTVFGAGAVLRRATTTGARSSRTRLVWPDVGRGGGVGWWVVAGVQDHCCGAGLLCDGGEVGGGMVSGRPGGWLP
jgi:hypothetical protein